MVSPVANPRLGAAARNQGNEVGYGALCKTYSYLRIVPIDHVELRERACLHTFAAGLIHP